MQFTRKRFCHPISLLRLSVLIILLSTEVAWISVSWAYLAMSISHEEEHLGEKIDSARFLVASSMFLAGILYIIQLVQYAPWKATPELQTAPDQRTENSFEDDTHSATDKNGRQ
ncbi:unnamed protein product [Cyprideis torosa]|uniref:Uncharacterized protein n=1 Tax=Cyprideis torosa TaxID=163714 RepID=A0A7R8ZQI9_9CRUS|nr:unnamed protein product [Cyprideis torosa]CAG0896500.1 unnamed protein product [Cyprideis torosa]